MLGCCRAPAARASRMKRSCASADRPSRGSSLRATKRRMTESYAFHTAPIAPSPMSSCSSNLPTRRYCSVCGIARLSTGTDQCAHSPSGQQPAEHESQRVAQSYIRPSRARVASSTTTSRRGSTRSAILRNPSLLMRWSLAPPRRRGGTYFGGRTSSNTFAPVPITVPVLSSVPIAVLAWSPIRLPRNCKPVSSRVPASSSRTRPYVFFRFDVIVPAPRLAQRPITQWPTKPSCALFAYPRNTQLESSPRALERGRIAEHDASGGDGVAVAEQAVQVVGEQPLEGGDQVVGAVKHDARHLDRGGVRLRTVPRSSPSDAPSHRDAAAREAEGAVRERGSEPARREGR